MATILSTSHLNLAEAQKRAGYDGSKGILAELEQTNDLLKVMPWFTASDGSFHKYLKAKKLGKGSFVDINDGIPNLASESDFEIMQIFDMEGDSEIDEKLLKTSKDPKAIRNSEDMMNAEGFMQGFMDALIYGDSAKGFKGFANLRSALLTKRVWSAGGSGSDVTSAWLVEFGEHAVNLRYPEGQTPGLTNEDRGRHKVDAPSGSGQMWAWVRHFALTAGVQVFNDKCLLRMANIETSGSSNIFSLSKALEMKNTLPHKGKFAAWLVNSTVLTQMEAALLDKGNVSYSRREIEGFGSIVYCLGIPVLTVDAILDTESALS